MPSLVYGHGSGHGSKAKTDYFFNHINNFTPPLNEGSLPTSNFNKQIF